MPQTKASLRILHAFRAPLGGLFRHVLDLSREQIASGHQVGLFCDSEPRNDHSERMLAAIAPTLALGLTRRPIARNPHPGDLPALLAIRRLIRDQAIDVVHGHGSKGGVLARVSAMPRSGPAIRVYTPHGGSLYYRPGTAIHQIYMLAEWAMAARTDLFTFESDYVRRTFEVHVGKPRGIARVVHNGLHPAEFEPIIPNDDAADLVFVGEFLERKGLAVLIDAMKIVESSLGRVPSAWMIGSGPYEATLRARIAAYGWDASVRVGTARPIREAFALGRVLAMPSLSESLPYVVLETVAACQPIIVTDVGGISEVFTPDDRASLIPAADAPALARALMDSIASDGAERSRHAARRSAFVRQHFSAVSMAQHIERGYRDALERKAGVK